MSPENVQVSERAGALATACLSAASSWRASARRSSTGGARRHVGRRPRDAPPVGPDARPEPSPEAAVGGLRRDLARLLVKDSALDDLHQGGRGPSERQAAAAPALTPISPPPPPLPSVQKENVSPARGASNNSAAASDGSTAYATTTRRSSSPTRPSTSSATAASSRRTSAISAGRADRLRRLVRASTRPIDYARRCRAGGRRRARPSPCASATPSTSRASAASGTPAKGRLPLRALFRVISSSRSYAAQKHTAALWVKT